MSIIQFLKAFELLLSVIRHPAFIHVVSIIRVVDHYHRGNKLKKGSRWNLVPMTAILFFFIVICTWLYSLVLYEELIKCLLFFILLIQYIIVGKLLIIYGDCWLST